ncbi:hypothetical protein A9Q84_12225 [Halobacteriovorax marinus]|uniref:Uncharacterized protein n=1 Tax=Halobacteriovorax marinus TaxID=97084 RepID=A0A1Y5FCB3_9BACT|nr:hypothetical protein A9Q84_12225 [Halobacteriovorax marinus]
MKLRSQRTYILPTGPGLVLGLVLLIEFIVALTFGHPFAYALSFLSIGVIVISAFHTNTSLEKIKFLSVKNNLIEQDAVSSISLNIDFPNGFEKRVLICNFEGQKYLTNQVIGKELSTIDVSIMQLKRGVSAFPRLKVQTTYPLGIFKSWKYLDIENSLNTYPRKVILEESETIFSQQDTNMGENSTLNRNLDEFLEHRKFRETDSWKQIDWKAFARGRGLLTKTYTGNSEESTTFQLLKSYSEKDLQMAAAFLFDGFERNKQTCLMYEEQIISCGEDFDHLQRCLRNLCSYEVRDV